MLHIVLFEPEIPPNTGNIIRLAANTGFYLHLIEPLGFQLDDKRLRRAGLDYSEFARVQVHRDLAAFQDAVQPQRVLAMTTHGAVNYHTLSYRHGDALLFGPETRGLPADIRESDWVTDKVRIPMLPNSRSLNLANAVSVVAFEAWRQLDFAGAVPDNNPQT